MAKDLSAMANNNKSYMAKPGEVESKWYVVDATDMVLGRLASQVAAILKGKNKPEYTPHVDCGDHVIVINCDKVVLTGKKLEQKYYRYHTGYIGGLKEVQYKKLMNEKPEFAVYKAVKGMLPQELPRQRYAQEAPRLCGQRAQPSGTVPRRAGTEII